MGDAVKLDFSTRAMDIGTPSFNLMRTLSVAATGGAEAGECLFVADRVKNVIVHIDAPDDLTAKFQVICVSPSDATVMASLIEAGFMLRQIPTLPRS